MLLKETEKIIREKAFEQKKGEIWAQVGEFNFPRQKSEMFWEI